MTERPTLVCFHHAGGAASVFRTWKQEADLPVHAVQLPGRESRIGEPRHTTLTTLVDSLLPELADVLAGPHVLFGHSMGALVAHALTRRRLALGLRPPLALLVAAYVAPHEEPIRLALERMTDLELATTLCDIDGLHPEFLKRPEWLGPLLATVKDDLRVCASHHHGPTAPLPVPIHAFGGTDDPLVAPAKLVSWEAHTTAEFGLTWVPGGHFMVTAKDSTLREDVFALTRRFAGAPVG
ncbi:thioesterase II family protein [Actinokineospora sp. G85]|uniref:thioesterase II family protein n=1 Tax=Actinokineospora sp. G85 TaxID=3406626 RepID=UPI003C747158